MRPMRTVFQIGLGALTSLALSGCITIGGSGGRGCNTCCTTCGYAQPAPAPPTPAPKVQKKIVLRGVNFDFDKSNIRPDAEAILDEAARILQEETGADVRIEGHTDARGTVEYNQGLSMRRARSVRHYLVEKGIDADRLSTVGYSELQPVATNETEDGRAQNRRVELELLD